MELWIKENQLKLIPYGKKRDIKSFVLAIIVLSS